MAYLPGTEEFVLSRPWLWGGGTAPSSVIIECPHYFQSRTPLSKQNIPTPQGTFMLFTYPDVFWQPADPYLFNSFIAGNKDYLFIRNTNLSLPRTAIIHSYPEPVFGRRGEVVITVDAGTTVVAGPIPKLGFMQGDGNIWVDGQTAEILFLPLTFS